MKPVWKTVPVLFMVGIIAMSLVPAFASASDPSGPAIYFADSIFAGGQVFASGVGFTPSATVTFKCGDEGIQTVPNPLVADSSGGFTVLLLTGKLGDGSCTITATDGANTAQATITVNEHVHDPRPQPCSVKGNSADTACCGVLAHSTDGGCCGTFARSADAICCGQNDIGLDTPCGPPPPPPP